MAAVPTSQQTTAAEGQFSSVIYIYMPIFPREIEDLHSACQMSRILNLIQFFFFATNSNVFKIVCQADHMGRLCCQSAPLALVN